MDELISSLPNNIELAYIPLILFAMFIHFLLEPLRWYLYTTKLFSIDYNRMFSIFSLTALVSYLLPMKMGLPTRMFLLRKKAGIGILQCSTLLMLDGLINYACWGITAVTSFYLLVKQDVFEDSFVTIIVTSILTLLLLYFIWKKRRTIIPKSMNAGIEKMISNDNSGIKQLSSEIDRQIIFKSLLVMPIDIGSHVVHHWAIFSMLGINLEWGAVFVITTVSIFTGMISMMPMGLGGYDAMLVLLLMQYSIEPEYAVSIAIINRLTILFISIVSGIYGGTQLELNPFKTQWRKLLSSNTQ